MKANFRGVTTAHTQTGTRSHWKRRDEARKREIARSKDDKRMSSLIMSEMASEIAELRKPKPMIVKLDPEEARLFLSEGCMVWATVDGKRERCWLTVHYLDLGCPAETVAEIVGMSVEYVRGVEEYESRCRV